MTDKIEFDLDTALAALRDAEQALQPTVSSGLQARVLADAADVAARISAERAATAAAAPKPADSAQSPGRFRLFGYFDLWSGGTTAALVLCLSAGIGVGYEAGPEVMAQAGLGEPAITLAADDSDDGFLLEDVL